MKITLLCIGKLKKDTPENQIIADYIKQCKWPIVVKELEEKKKLSPSEMKRAESALLINALPPNVPLIVLDETGKEFTSRDFSEKLISFQNKGAAEIVFMIGGAGGHTDELRTRADLILAMGKWTLPHMLARVVLVEQIYRAKTIADNHPYHKD